MVPYWVILLVFFMRSLYSWPIFPSNLEPPVARSLSIQFILQALIDAFHWIQELKMSNSLKGVNTKEEIGSIYNELEKTFLFSLENPLSQRGGLLDKICFYSEILLQASQIKETELIFVFEDLRKEILVFKTKLMIWKKLSSKYPLEEILEQLMQLKRRFFQNFQTFFKALTPFLKEARSDENVLVYLIENKEELNRNLGPKCIEELLQSFFPAGHDQLRAVIYEGYTRRGFNAFFSTVEPLIDEVQWETSCQSQSPL